ncbi:hypothetical protein ACTFIU_006512 [Dictyostelium citrinum]
MKKSNNKQIPQTSKLVTYDSFRSNDKSLILSNLNKLNDWINNKSNFKDIEETGIFKALSELIDKYNENQENQVENNEYTEIIIILVKFLKNLSVKETETNEILRSLDYIHRLELILNNSYDSDLLNDSSTTIECLRKCAPYSVRKVGVGEYSEQTGQFQWMIEMKQLHFDEVFVGWRVWEAGIGFGKWVLENKQIFQGKEVLELGSGLGVAGFMAGLICKSVLMTDYTPKLVSALKDNLKTNSKILEIKKACTVQALDWVNDKAPKPFHYDIVIGSEVIYDEKIVDHLANIIHQSLTPNGVFYSTAATVRRGIPEFIHSMKSRGYTVNCTEFPKRFMPDTKFDTHFFEIYRNKNK